MPLAGARIRVACYADVYVCGSELEWVQPFGILSRLEGYMREHTDVLSELENSSDVFPDFRTVALVREAGYPSIGAQTFKVRFRPAP